MAYKQKEKTEFEKAGMAAGAALNHYFEELGYEIMKNLGAKRKKPHPIKEVAQAPSEEDNGFTDETKWGTCTPAFIMENGMAESEERAIEIAKYLKEHPEKKECSFLKELFVKAQFKMPTAQRLNSADFNFVELAMVAKDDPIKIEAVKEEPKEEEANVTNTAATTEEEPNVANPAATVQAPTFHIVPDQQPNPFGYNPMAQFMQGIPMEQPGNPQSQYAQTLQYWDHSGPAPQQFPQTPNIANVNGVLYKIVMGPNGPIMTPYWNDPTAMGGQQVNPTETQQVPPPHPVGFIVKERESKELVDEGMKIEGELPKVDSSLIKEQPTKVKITPMVEKVETPVENPAFAIVKGGHPDVSEEEGNTLLFDVLNTIKDAGYTCNFRELRDEEMSPVGIYEFHLFNGDQELTDLKFIVDLGKVFDKRAKFCIGASAGLEYKEWFELQKNVGKNLVYTDETLKKFFANGRKWLFNQRAMYNRQWREINKNFVDLSTLPDMPNKEARQQLNGIISDLYNCRELQATISDVIPDPRFKVVEFNDGVLILSNGDVKDNILGSVRKDPLIAICYGGSAGKNVAVVKTANGTEAQVTVPHNIITK